MNFLIILILSLFFNSSHADLKLHYDENSDHISFLKDYGIFRDSNYKNLYEEKIKATACSEEQKDAATFCLIENIKNSSIDDLLIAAKKLSTEHVGSEDKIIFLGRSTFVFKYIFDRIRTDLNPDHSVSLFFSGSPDAINIRQAENSLNSDTPRNLVTPENLSIFENYLTELGLNRVSGKLYIVDVISTGNGLNSFLRILAHYYRTYLKIPLPQIYFVGLNLNNQTQSYPPNSSDLIWKYGANQKKLAFAERKQYGIYQMTVDTIPLGLSKKTYEFLDSPQVQEPILGNLSFPAFRWTENNQKSLFKFEKIAKEDPFFKTLDSFLTGAHQHSFSNISAFYQFVENMAK